MMDTTFTRAEHIRWCKRRALSYLQAGELHNAVSSMLSDLTKHPETEGLARGPLGMIGMWEANNGDMNSVRAYIEGFAE
jgi:hypothetical protein